MVQPLGTPIVGAVWKPRVSAASYPPLPRAQGRGTRLRQTVGLREVAICDNRNADRKLITAAA